MSKFTHILLVALSTILFWNCNASSKPILEESNSQQASEPAAYSIHSYLPILKGKRVGLVVNHTSTIGKVHLVDTLLALGINITVIFAPEHGFKGEADAGEKITNSMYKTNIPIRSLYGKDKKPSSEDILKADIVLFDIQDVGVRFYTFLSTLHYVLEAAGENVTPVIVLDRPNPNIHRIDGPVLEAKYASFVGLHPVPILYGMTIGEYAKMIVGEAWLANKVKVQLTVFPCKYFSRQSRYIPPIAPSPNLPNIRSMLLYPSICLFEGTHISEGRGTNKQFQLYGHPDMDKSSFSFTPTSMDGAKYPKHENVTCGGVDLTTMELETLYQSDRIDLSYLLHAYKELATQGSAFFLESNFFEKLAGNDLFRQQLTTGKSESEIRASWQKDLELFKKVREKYLIYQ